ncbi:uncharacterized protein LOC125030386 [Penaeus chinensis]|uniref:uncharacterized protein LOC125030386 n=1 Tax=Penaeus chinensis TaxID=139456 RepID=UPI001FB75AB8|nr:uncharacterized protein LOC125030386 [Penaeus chinensis]
MEFIGTWHLQAQGHPLPETRDERNISSGCAEDHFATILPGTKLLRPNQSNMKTVALLVFLAGVVAALPHGECNLMGALRRGRHLHRGRLPPCVRGLMPQGEELKACFKENFRKYRFRNGQSAGLRNGFEGMVECMVEKMNLELVNGTLDVEQAVLKLSEFEGYDIEAIASIQSSLEECAANSTSSNATEQLTEIVLCVSNKSREFCTERLELLKTWDENANCSSVSIPTETLSIIEECEPDDDSPRRRGPTRRRGRKPADRGHGKKMWSQVLCVNENIGSYNASTGFNFTVIAEHIATFSGWDTIPGALENLTEKIIECQPEFADDAQTQAAQWMLCLRPSYVEICGLGGDLTEFLFPAIKKMIKESSEEDGDDVDEPCTCDIFPSPRLFDTLKLTDETDDLLELDEEVEMLSSEADDPEVMLGQMRRRSRRRRQRGRKNSSEESNESRTPDNSPEDDSDEVTTVAPTTVFP